MPTRPTAANARYLVKAVKALPPSAAVVTDCTEKTMVSPNASRASVAMSRA
ncbi:Hypothetical protein AAM4_1208 [Actinomyces succiniciruminis]|uniref:Uncharacterized protein n=1 Tax=Actinomyces succiniciruminis TaxID=1522002 RepID=A0A1L7RLJ8_9ACTO|nr:Hypothetical protein AAM4_1208 [Actinomyces succiniciruminis]